MIADLITSSLRPQPPRVLAADIVQVMKGLTTGPGGRRDVSDASGPDKIRPLAPELEPDEPSYPDTPM